LARTIEAIAGTPAKPSCHDGGSASISVSSALACFVRSAGLVSTRWTRSAAKNAGAVCLIARSASASSVPRPGPSSTRATGCGLPMLVQTPAHQRPISSPKTCEISGAVMKSPARPSGSRLA